MYDDVRGTIIGEVDTRRHYGFYDKEGKPITCGNFKTDAEAIAWFKAGWPSRYAEGVEMRVWDN